MSRSSIVFLIVLFFSIPLFAQSVDTTWVRRYNGSGSSSDRAVALKVDGSGNVYVVGYSVSSELGQDYVTIKYYPNGDTAWVRSYDYEGLSEVPSDIEVDEFGNVYVTGKSESSVSNYDYATIKYDVNGDTVWVRRFDTSNNKDWSYAIALDDSGYVYVTGWSFGTMDDFMTIKYDPEGNVVWLKSYNGPWNNSDFAYDIEVDDLYNVYITGQSYKDYLNSDFITIKYYPNGDTAWIRTYYEAVDTSMNLGCRIAIDDSGYVYVAGVSTGFGTSLDYLTIKYQPDGDTVWIRRYDGSLNNPEILWDMCVSDSGNSYLTGRSGNLSSECSYATVTYNPEGDTAWVRNYVGPTALDEALAITVDLSENVYVTGFSRGVEMDFDFATVKYSANGEENWVRWYDGPAGGMDGAFDVAVYNNSCFADVYVAGESYGGSETGSDFIIIKYVQFTCGDTNRDCDLSLSDIVYLISYLFKKGPDPLPVKGVGDANCDGSVSLSDIVYLINHLFKGGPPPCC